MALFHCINGSFLKLFILIYFSTFLAENWLTRNCFHVLTSLDLICHVFTSLDLICHPVDVFLGVDFDGYSKPAVNPQYSPVAMNLIPNPKCRCYKNYSCKLQSYPESYTVWCVFKQHWLNQPAVNHTKAVTTSAVILLGVLLFMGTDLKPGHDCTP